MRLGVLVLAFVAVMGIAACGVVAGGDDASPLTLEQRVSGDAEAPGVGGGSS